MQCEKMKNASKHTEAVAADLKKEKNQHYTGQQREIKNNNNKKNVYKVYAGNGMKPKQNRELNTPTIIDGKISLCTVILPLCRCVCLALALPISRFYLLSYWFT